MPRRPLTARRSFGKRFTARFDRLELRSLMATDLTVPLDPALDQFGDQIMTIMGYGDGTQSSFGIFDTGASAITFSPDDAGLFDFNGAPIPIKNPGGAVAEGIGGTIIGDVSEPGNIVADGIHASTLSFDADGFPIFGTTLDQAAQTSNIQAFVGTSDGSPDLPTITGTPILEKSPEHPNGLAALVSMIGDALDFSDIAPGLVIPIPDIHFVDPSTTLSAESGTTDPVRILTTPYGGDNYGNPGDLITEAPNQTIEGVNVVTTTAEVDGKNFLFDTGAQLSVISTDVAAALGFDINNPETTITVQGVGGTETVPGFTLKELTLPTADGGWVHLTDIPVYVLDVAPGIDGILGMNAFDTADKFLFNPYDPTAPDGHGTLTITYQTNPDRSSIPFDPSDLNFLFGPRNIAFTNALSGHSVPIYKPKGAPLPGSADASIDFVPMSPSPVVGQVETFLVNLPADAIGYVSLIDGTTDLGQVQVVAGEAQVQSGPLTLGNHTFKISYSGDSKYAAKVTTTKTLTVAKDSTSIAMSTTPSRPLAGRDLTITATVAPVAPGAGTPTGSVVFKEGKKTLAVVPLVNGSASFHANYSPVGKAHKIVASYLGDANDLPSTSPVFNVVPQIVPTSISLTHSVVTVTKGKKTTTSDRFTLEVAGEGIGPAPTGSVTITAGGRKFTVALVRGKATLTVPSTAVLVHSATAKYSGNTLFASSTGTFTF